MAGASDECEIGAHSVKRDAAGRKQTGAARPCADFTKAVREPPLQSATPIDFGFRPEVIDVASASYPKQPENLFHAPAFMPLRPNGAVIIIARHTRVKPPHGC